MQKLKRTKCKRAMLILLSILFLWAAFGFSRSAATAEAAAVQPQEEPAETQGLYVVLRLALTSDGDVIYSTVTNTFTLFPSTVYVIVELYYSEEYYESYSDMTLAARNTIADLDQGESISASASTGGKQLWWQARMRYKKDNDTWKEMYTNSYEYAADGTLLG